MRKTHRALALAMALAAPRARAAEPELVLKLATLAPQGSSWHGLLREMGERWAEASGGRVRLRIYAGGTQGGEGDMVRKMAVGQLHAAAITNVGMHDIVAEPAVFTAPGLVASDAEFQALLPRLAPRLEALLAARGYAVLHWVSVGMAQLYCDRPYRTPAEMSGARVFAWEGDPAAVEAFRAAGFHPVVLGVTDIPAALQTGMIGCVVQPAAYALTARIFETAHHMVDYPWAYLVGATIVRREAWERVPPGLRPRLLAIAAEAGVRLDADARRLGQEAVAAMRKQGLEVVAVDPAPWRAAAERTWPVIRGKVMPAAFFDEVVRVRDEVRAGR
jgi:TRAP-type C4-dicarboxylate transport system substrate-binding protein